MSKTVTLTEAEAKLVMQCLDLACKQGGLNAAAQILPVAASIERQLTASPTPAPAESFGQPQGGLASFAEASGEAVADLMP
jgi:hypothetical protein